MTTNNEKPEKNTMAHCLSVRDILVVSLTLGSRLSSVALLSRIFFFLGDMVLADVTDEKTPLMGPGDWFGAFVRRNAQTRKRTSVDAGSESYSNFVFGP